MKYKNNEELKKEFIKYFGVEKWEAEEIISQIHPDVIAICDYLGVEPIPVIMDDIKEDAKYFVDENYIAISQKLVKDLTKVRRCLLHELRHYYQYVCIKHKIGDNELRNAWIEDLKKNDRNLIDFEKVMLSYEVDAYAFTKFFMKNYYNANITHPDKWYDVILDLYIEKFLS